MKSTEPKGFAGPLRVIAVFIIAAATLRYAQDFFLPLVLAGLLSFLLSPLVRRLERWCFGRVGAVLATALMAFVLIGGLTYLVTNQFLDLAGSLPKYRDNLIARVSALKLRGDSLLGRASRTLSEVSEAMSKSEQTPVAEPVTTPANSAPMPVKITRADDNPIRTLMDLLTPIVGPLGNTVMVIVIVIFMLLAGSDLRDRLIHLLGRSRLRVTTQALDEAAMRIGRYLRAQLLVNASFGIAIAIGLHFIGVQNAVFWGLLGMVLRFLPYIGAWIAAAFPLALSIAMFQSWSQPLLTLGLFVAAEIIVANVIEPWLYGTSTEISSLAVVVSAVFWTWLWGGVGLVLATPMTVCLAVAGKYLPDLAFLDMLMGDKPSIAPSDRLYQRLLALNNEEAGDIVEQYATEKSASAAFDEVVIPALRVIESDFRSGELSEDARSEACQIVREIIAELAPSQTPAASEGAPILLLPAYHEADELAALMLSQVLAESGVATTVLSSTLLASEEVAQAVALAPRIVCISSIPPASSIAARALCKRLRSQLPGTRIIVGVWKTEDAAFAVRRERLGKVGADATYPDLRRCATDIAEFAACTPSPDAVAQVAD